MSISVNSLVNGPNTNTSSSTSNNGIKDVVKNPDFNDKGTDKLVVQYQKQAVYHNEPLFIVNNESMYGYENYKEYDQYTGHAIQNTPEFQDDIPKNNGKPAPYYYVEKNGKQYASGKTYYLGLTTLMVPIVNPSKTL